MPVIRFGSCSRRRPRYYSLPVRSLAIGLLAVQLSWAQTASSKSDEKRPEISWQIGPRTAKLGNQAELTLPAGYGFADAENTRKFLDSTQNIPSGRELGTVAPVEGHWFAIFEFDAVGYVKDDEKDKLDAEVLLTSIKKATEAQNELRKQRGWGTFQVTGWLQPPHYDTNTHQLTWCFVGTDESGIQSANYRTRLLGRHGVMSVELVTSPRELDSALPAFRSAATGGFHFNPDSQYSAFANGDKVAKYGLTGLILGGAAAAAVKTGLLKYLVKMLIVGWKLVAVALAALLAFLKKLFTGRKRTQSAANTD